MTIMCHMSYYIISWSKATKNFPSLKDLRKFTKGVIKRMRAANDAASQTTVAETIPDAVIDLDPRILAWFLGPKKQRIVWLQSQMAK